VYIVPYPVVTLVNTEVVAVGTIGEIGKIETVVVVDKIDKKVAVMHYTYYEPAEMSSNR
jgi:hypothetical protein